MSGYSKNEAWNIAYEDNLLVLSAGADKIFAVEDVDESTAKELLALWKSKSINLNHLSLEARRISEQLKTAGILINQIEPKPKYKIGLSFVGNDSPELKKSLSHQLPDGIRLSGEKEIDLEIIIRTNGRLRDVVGEPYSKKKVPHLFVDTAYEHSLSVGPLVFMGGSACLGCFVGRLSEYWGGAEPPVKPLFLQNTALIAGLAAMEATKVLTQNNRELVNNTVAYDFESHKVRSNKVYKLPMCPICSTSTIDIPGAIKLPWVKQAEMK